MPPLKNFGIILIATFLIIADLAACNGQNSAPLKAADPTAAAAATPSGGTAANCQLVPSGFGPLGTTPLHTVPVITGLVTPWDVAVLPDQDWLISERPGRLRLAQAGGGGMQLLGAPVLTLTTVGSGEGGLLGIALDPGFSSSSGFYLYYTAVSSTAPSGYVNRVQRFTLAADHKSAVAGPVILDNIPWNSIHDGGRIKFGPDGMLYISVGEGADASAPQDASRINGKILRLAPDGTIPSDNPDPTNAWFLKGLRNTQAFDWTDPQTIILADNGPTGEYLGETGGDKVMLGQKGDDLGWPTIWHCQSQAGLISPILTWVDALPPGGALIYQGTGEFPQWAGNLLIGSTGGEQLHRVVLGADGVTSHEVYLQGAPPQGLGRLRTVFQDASGELYVTTSNCDSRGSCPAQQDGIYRIVPGTG